MKTSMLAAIILALYTFCAACWYAPSLHGAGEQHGIETCGLRTYGRGVSGDFRRVSWEYWDFEGVDERL